MQAATGLLWANLRQRVQLVVVSGGLPKREVERMGAKWRRTVDAAVEGALAAYSTGERYGTVAIVPQAGVVLPLLQSPEPVDHNPDAA